MKNTLIRDGVPSIVNPFDGYALKAAARIKDKNPDTKTAVLSMAPPQATAVLKECLAIDGDTAQVGPELAEHLGYPQITYGLGAEVNGDMLKVKKEVEEGVEVIGVKIKEPTMRRPPKSCSSCSAQPVLFKGGEAQWNPRPKTCGYLLKPTRTALPRTWASSY